MENNYGIPGDHFGPWENSSREGHINDDYDGLGAARGCWHTLKLLAGGVATAAVLIYLILS